MIVETKFNIGQTVSCCIGLKFRKVYGRKSKIDSILIQKAEKPYVNNKKFKIFYGLNNFGSYINEDDLFLTIEEAEIEEKKRCEM